MSATPPPDVPAARTPLEADALTQLQVERHARVVAAAALLRALRERDDARQAVDAAIREWDSPALALGFLRTEHQARSSNHTPAAPGWGGLLHDVTHGLTRADVERKPHDHGGGWNEPPAEAAEHQDGTA